MTNLINITNQEGNLLVSSREVATHFEKRNPDVNRAIEILLEETSTQSSTDLFILNQYKDSYGRSQKEYLLTRDGFTLLAMGFTGAKAIHWKLKYIDAFNKMEKTLKEGQPLEITSKFMYQLAQTLEEKERQIALDRPKVIFAEALETSNQSVLVGELAKLLARNKIENMGQNRLFIWLRENSFLHKKGEQYNLPTQKAIELEVIETKITTINNPDGSVRVTKTPKITGKGQIYFVNRFKKDIC